MAEGEVHRHLKKLALHFLKEKVTDLVANEVPFKNAYSIADACGVNLKRREVRVIECKATKADFIRDKKLWGLKTSYYYHAHYAYIMCPVGIIQPDEVPNGYGLLWVDEHDKIEVKKTPVKQTARLKTLFDTTLKRTARCLTNTFLFHEENKENKDETAGAFSRQAKILLISTKCPDCKKTFRELIHKESTKTITCECGKSFPVAEAKIREITGFNKKFIKRINELDGTKK